MTIGFAPEPTLHQYIAKVQRLLPQHPLTPDEREWARLSRLGGIKASKFAGWLALTASSPLLPTTLQAAEKNEPPSGTPAGRGNLEEITND